MSEIVIVAYRADWEQQFAEVAREIRKTVADEIVRIDHIGSTAVPNLAAKDILDIQLTVRDLSQTDYLTKLQAAGFRLRESVNNDLLTGVSENSMELQKRFLREAPGRRRTHIHVREQGRLNQEYALLFRDYLRSDELVRNAYEQVKKELASHFQNDADAYYRVKDPYMDTIYRGAKLWAQLNDWHPDNNFL